MAREAVWYGQLTPELMNGTASYRVALSYGVFSIAAKVTQGGTYYYALKRADGTLFKVYVGKAGEITAERIHEATMALHGKLQAATGRWQVRSNRGHESEGGQR